MRNTILVIIAVVLIGLVVGTILKDLEPETELKHSLTAMQREKAEAQTEAADHLMQNYAFAQKAKFVDKMKTELAGIQKELDLFSAKVDMSAETVKIDRKSTLDAMRVKWARTKQQLDKAESAGESDWYDANDSFRKCYVDLKDSVEKTRRQLNDKVKS